MAPQGLLDRTGGSRPGNVQSTGTERNLFLEGYEYYHVSVVSSPALLVPLCFDERSPFPVTCGVGKI